MEQSIYSQTPRRVQNTQFVIPSKRKRFYLGYKNNRIVFRWSKKIKKLTHGAIDFRKICKHHIHSIKTTWQVNCEPRVFAIFLSKYFKYPSSAQPQFGACSDRFSKKLAEKSEIQNTQCRPNKDENRMYLSYRSNRIVLRWSKKRKTTNAWIDRFSKNWQTSYIFDRTRLGMLFDIDVFFSKYFKYSSSAQPR